MKKLVPAYILSCIISFMLFLYEPIIMYANNINDFWFDFKTIILPLLLLFIGVFVLLSIFYTLLYWLNNKFFRKKKIYELILLLSFGLFISTYIEGNYLAMLLPSLDGSDMAWNSHLLEKIISFFIWIIPITSLLILGKKHTFTKIIDISKYISLGITFMLMASFVSVLLTSNIFSVQKTPIISTKENLSVASNKSNFFIFLVDAVDSKSFNEILEKSEYKDTFKDFTYYPDTLSAYLYTRDSIPFLMSGKWNYNEMDFQDYATDALNNSPLLEKLQERKYSINIYDTELIWNSEKTNTVDNLIEFEGRIELKSFYKQVLKYVLFKYLPFSLKQYSRIETMDFNVCKNAASSDYFIWDNSEMYQILDNKLDIKDQNYFKFIHLEGAHAPFNSDKDINKKSNGTYEEKEEATLKLINKFINSLKDNNVYDNSSVIILADHGYNGEELVGRQNPILYIKGINEHHEMITSEKAISYDDLISAYMDLLDDKQSTDLFQNVDSNRERVFISYRYLDEDHMEEYKALGKAWENEKLEKTNKEYNRSK